MSTKSVPAEAGSLPQTRTFPYKTLHEVNARCIELLVNAARSERQEALPLAKPLREILRSSDPDMRRRAAERGILLVEFAFHDANWWRGVTREPTGRRRTSFAYPGFPRRTAIPLARATLMLAWYAIQEDLETATVLLGMTREVAEAICGLHLSDIDRIAERGFRHILPRWHDQPDYWCELLEAARSGTPAVLRRCNLRGLQMIVGEQLRPSARSHR